MYPDVSSLRLGSTVAQCVSALARLPLALETFCLARILKAKVHVPRSVIMIVPSVPIICGKPCQQIRCWHRLSRLADQDCITGVVKQQSAAHRCLDVLS